MVLPFLVVAAVRRDAAPCLISSAIPDNRRCFLVITSTFPLMTPTSIASWLMRFTISNKVSVLTTISGSPPSSAKVSSRASSLSFSICISCPSSSWSFSADLDKTESIENIR
eukprot:17782_5